MPIYRLSLYAGIALVSIGVILFLFDTPRGLLEEFNLDSNEDLHAYAIAKNASTQYFNDDGSLSYTFKSSKLSHFRPSDNPTESYTSVESPDIVVYDDIKPWHIFADNGQVDADRVITLNNNVRLEQIAEDAITSTLTTSELVLNAEAKLAYTDKAVTIETHLGEVTAVGMRANMTNRNIKLLSKVRGRHKPQIIAQ